MEQSATVATSERAPLLEPECEPVRNPSMPKYGLMARREAREARLLPQTIGHRGFKAVSPENTMAAFKAATEAGVEAIETDLHLTRDGVVVLCHDETLQRCYGNKAKVRDLDWNDISQLRTLREPRQPMPRLIDLLGYLSQPGLEDVWLMLDIKTHDDAEEIIQRTAQALACVSSQRPWNTRVTPCCWNAKYIKLSMKYLPGYPITHVGFSISYARCLTDIPNVSFSMLRYTLATPSGKRFLRDMDQLGIPVHVWTVNEESWMEWSIREKISGVITDEVALFHEVCNRMGNSNGQPQAVTHDQKKATGLNSWFLYRTARFWGEMALFHFLITIFMARERLKYGSPRHRINKELHE
ncbi:putative glycerophosphoryl diester phosphodiesterase protein [Rosellinia necatrix]|uniref:Putative glycerophosphoryl diester phosphodiesterase protein n=1 Tax=Rosellinia necatrix TaxID=77044 RepID=A0A1W2TD07_ROSNE|nr:putative glycerophosphoryl diester phosphodiesterase protein [Rosellinia necatrix]